MEHFNAKTNEFQATADGDIKTVLDELKRLYPNTFIEVRSDGVISIDKVMTPEEKLIFKNKFIK